MPPSTEVKLPSVPREAPLVGGTLLAGFGRADVTPAHPVEMSGYAARVGLSSGVNDRLEARCLLVQAPAGSALALVTLDVIGVDAGLTHAVRAAVAEAVAEAAGLELAPERVGVVASHTHSGPATLRGARLGAVDDAVVATLVAGAATAAEAAASDLTPGEFRLGSAVVPGLAANRRDPRGPVDPELQVLGFWERGAAQPRGLLASFALHPVVLGPDNLLLTRDYIGFLLGALEATMPGCTPLFATGFAGQVNDGHPATASDGAPTDRRSFTAARRVGERLAAAVPAALAAAVRGPCPGELDAAHGRVELPYAAPKVDPPRAAGAWRRELADATAAPGAGVKPFRLATLPAMIAWAEQWGPVWAAGGPEPRSRACEVQALGIEGFALVLCPGEPFVEYGLRLKRSHRGRVLPLGYANDAPGYLPTAAAWGEGGYEVDLAYVFYGEPGPYAPELESSLGAALSAVTQEIVRC